MIKVETIGMLDVAKVNPVLTSEKDVENYNFVVDNDDIYLIMNTPSGDDSYKEDVVIKSGEFLNGYLVKAWEGQKLVIDGKHIDDDISSLTPGTSILVVDEATGKLKSGSATGVHFVVTDKTTLTEAAVKARICIA